MAYVADALQGQSARDWAWQQLALLPATRERRNSDAQRHQGLMRLLADDADDSVPLLRVLLRSPSWPLLIARLQDGELRGLAQSVFTRLAGSSVVGFAEPADDTSMAASSVAPSSGTSATPAMFDAAPSWLRATVQAARTVLRTRWALRLGCLLAQPSLAQRGALAVDAQLSAWSATAAGNRPEAVPADTADTADTEHAPAPAPAQGLVTKTAAAAATTSTPRAPLPAAQAAPASADTRGRTEHGGLLFLVPVLPLCGALALLQDAAVWRAGSLPQALHRLALQLGPQAQDDAAALAFCGLLPDSPPPRHLQTTAAQDAALDCAQRLILDHLAERVPDWRGPALLTRLVRRAAVVSGDPGWIDIRFELRNVSLELRRAALDLDPGFVPWLGVVLRFRYE